MFCKKCGNEMPDDMKFCNRCGEPLAASAAESATRGNGTGDIMSKINLRTPSFMNVGNAATWLIIMFALAVLTMISMIFSGVGIRMSAMGQSISLSMPNTTLAMAFSAAGQGSAFGVYRVFLFFYLIINIISILFTVKKSALGILAGLAANLIVVIFSIVVIIAAFSTGTQIQQYMAFGNVMGLGSGMGASVYPTIWSWLSLVLGAANGALLLFKGRDIVS